MDDFGLRRTSERMDDETFLAFLKNNAPRCEVETLRKAVDELNENIASRVFGRPAGLEIGSHIEAVDFRGSWYRYGTVVKLSDSFCVIEPPVGRFTDRISFRKEIVRILDQYEWSRVCFSAESRKKEVDEETAREYEELAALRQEVIAERNSARRVVMGALNGPVELFCGAYVYAYRPDWGMHEYGLVIDMTPKKIVLSSPDSVFRRTQGASSSAPLGPLRLLGAGQITLRARYVRVCQIAFSELRVSEGIESIRNISA
jgi:hypothetical protein